MDKTFLDQCSICSSSDLKVENISYENELYISSLCNSCSFFETEKLENTVSDELSTHQNNINLKKFTLLDIVKFY